MTQDLSKCNIEEWMPQEVITHKLATFNETGDWSIFDDVPAIQHVCVMYPNKMELINIQPK